MGLLDMHPDAKALTSGLTFALGTCAFLVNQVTVGKVSFEFLGY